ncbi:MAG: class I SAM-dependent methyltransferase [Burkholderiaceae bacterium]|nr:class I SAM-dependent methyltransferase [Burkholderiaceae bacterium]
MAASDAPTERFSDRAQAYAAARPGYPQEIATALVRAFDLPPAAVVADLGSGTGLSCEPFLRAGLTVIGVEPNDAMRAAGERQLAAFAAFRSVKGTAEATALPDASVDLVIAAQAAHWFEPRAAGQEAKRILKRPPHAALVWNDRVSSGDPFAEGYEALLVEHGGEEYARVRHRHAQHDLVVAFFGHAGYRELRFANPTLLDFGTLAQRLNSASYVPNADSPGHAPMMAALRELFETTQLDGRVAMVYETRVFCGAIG